MSTSNVGKDGVATTTWVRRTQIKRMLGARDPSARLRPSLAIEDEAMATCTAFAFATAVRRVGPKQARTALRAVGIGDTDLLRDLTLPQRVALCEALGEDPDKIGVPDA